MEEKDKKKAKEEKNIQNGNADYSAGSIQVLEGLEAVRSYDISLEKLPFSPTYPLIL